VPTVEVVLGWTGAMRQQPGGLRLQPSQLVSETAASGAYYA
jgi:hypothetical protein